MICVQSGLSHFTRSDPMIFSSMSEAGPYKDAVSRECVLEHEGQCRDTLFEFRMCSVMHLAHTNFLHGVVTGRSTMHLQNAHCISQSDIFDAGGKKRDNMRGSDAIQVGGASLSMDSAM